MEGVDRARAGVVRVVVEEEEGGEGGESLPRYDAEGEGGGGGLPTYYSQNRPVSTTTTMAVGEEQAPRYVETA